MNRSFAAVDLGATSGRVMLGALNGGVIHLEQVKRFPNGPVPQKDGLHWDVAALYCNVLAGIAEAERANPLTSVGVDSWGVDYGLLKAEALSAAPFHYRDERTARASRRLLRSVDAATLFRRTGVQHANINTIVQLVDDRDGGRLDDADTMLLTPDLIGYWLTGERVAERTIASTTGLLRGDGQAWDRGLIEELKFPQRLFPSLIDAGTEVARLNAGLPSQAKLVAVGSHDTASALVAVPATDEDFAYVSCGTWGIVGVESETPALSEAARESQITNERGIDGRVRVQRNAMGLWILNESLRTWEREGHSVELPALLNAAADVSQPVIPFDADDPLFTAPGDMPARIASWYLARDLRAPSTKAELARSIVASLADGFARAVRDLSTATGRTINVIHVIGGGSQNALLCQELANRSERAVIAGPVEGSALGNVLVQARAAGVAGESLEVLRHLALASVETRRFTPRGFRLDSVR